jgi:hypothetical protein
VSSKFSICAIVRARRVRYYYLLHTFFNARELLVMGLQLKHPLLPSPRLNYVLDFSSAQNYETNIQMLISFAEGLSVHGYKGGKNWYSSNPNTWKKENIHNKRI